MKELKQVRGLFAYYAIWIANFLTKIRPLIDTEIFPLSDCAKRAFETLNKDLEDVTLMSIDEDRRFVLETDASNVAISATLNQNGKPVAFFSRTLNKSQKIYPLSNCAKRAFETLKKDLGDVTLMSIDEDQSFVLETDANNVAILSTLIQNGNQ